MPSLSNVPDLILINARVYTVNEAQPLAQAVAIRKHRFVAVGSDAEILRLAGTDTTVLDLNGKLILPGICDAHIHFYEWSLSLQEVQLAGTRSKAEMMDRIAERAAQPVEGEPAEAWIIGRGWNESRWGETDFPTAADIDATIGFDRPALFWRADMHGAVASTAALRLAGISAETPNPDGGVIDRDEAGNPTGVLRELAIALVADCIPRPSETELEDALINGIRTLHSLGITAIHDQRMKDQDDGPRMLAAYRRLRERSMLKLRVNCNIAAHDLPHLAGLGLRSGFGDDYLRLGHVKLFTDGSLGTRTAWMLEPFERLEPDEVENIGVNVTPPAQMAREFRQATELGFPISVHAIGDRANRTVLDIFEELADAGLEPPLPHRIEHVQIIDPIDLPRLAQLGITASVQPIHATDDIDTANRFHGCARCTHVQLPLATRPGHALGLRQRRPCGRRQPLCRHAGCNHAPETRAYGPAGLVSGRMHLNRTGHSWLHEGGFQRPLDGSRSSGASNPASAPT
jgi:predicted amidohydrolase YtcJ